MWLSYFCSRLNVGCLISHFELAGYSFTTVSQDCFFCVLWGGYVLILVQHYKRTFLEPLYKIQKLSIIDFHWLFDKWPKSSRALLCLTANCGWNWRLQALFHKKTDSDFSKEAILIDGEAFVPDANILQEECPLINPLPQPKTIGVSNPSFPIICSPLNPRRMDSEDFEDDFPFT